MAVCTGIVKVKTLAGAGDILKVTIDNTTEAYWIYEYASAIQFLNKEVIVDYRKDMLDGNLETFINTFTVPVVVTTLDKKDNIKLYVDQVDNNANVSFQEIEDGDTRLGCVVFCTQNVYKSSPKATWMELTIRDKTMHCATLRLFAYDNKDADFAGRYIKTNLTKSSYGFQSEYINPVDEEIFVNPEIALATYYVDKYFKNDEAIQKYLAATPVIECLKTAVDYEPGYGLMRLAMELDMVASMENITKDVDLQAIGRALLLRYGYMAVPSNLSHSYTNIAVAIRVQFENKITIMQLLDEALDEKPAEAKIMKTIIDTVSTILEVRKGTKFG